MWRLIVTYNNRFTCVYVERKAKTIQQHSNDPLYSRYAMITNEWTKINIIFQLVHGI